MNMGRLMLRNACEDSTNSSERTKFDKSGVASEERTPCFSWAREMIARSYNKECDVDCLLPFLAKGYSLTGERRTIPALVADLASLERSCQGCKSFAEEKVVHWGLLGFQHQQRLVVRLTILFKDRQSRLSHSFIDAVCLHLQSFAISGFSLHTRVITRQ